MGMQTKRLFGILAVVVGMVFWAGCSDSGNGNSGNDNGGGGDGVFSGIQTLNLSGQVWIREFMDNSVWTEFAGNRAVNGVCLYYFDDIGGSGAIENGQLNFSIGTPNISRLRNILDFFYEEDHGFIFFESDYENIVVSNQETRAAMLYPDAEGAMEFFRGIDFHFELYMFVDRNVSITATGKTTSSEITKDFTLNLKNGWNIINFKQDRSTTPRTITVSMGYAINNARWELLQSSSWQGGE
ncbi:MAG: hypothetical protein FWE23_03735 [Chitinivibrionia bacterium]|nr:hypothetical protein [Chitinivibrionia bacterium]